METRSATRRRRSTRNPLSDCTNTHDSQHSSSSSVASTSIKHFTSSSPTVVSTAKPAKPQKSTAASSAAAASLWGSCKENAFYASSSTSVPSRGLNHFTSVHAFNKHQKLKTDSTTRDENSSSTSKPSRVLDVSSSVPAFNKPQKLTIQRSTRNEIIASTSTTSHGLDPSSSAPAFHEPQKPTTLRSTININAVSASTPSRAPNPLSTITGTTSEWSDTFTIYRRRQSADKRRGTCDPVGLPNFSCLDAPNQLEKINDIGVNNQSTSTVPMQKKQHPKSPKKKVKDHSLPQDFVEKQKVYFAEIDAFELSEEEVDSVDELD